MAPTGHMDVQPSGSSLTYSRIEVGDLASLFQSPGTKPLTVGSSSNFSRNVNSFILNPLTPHVVMFLNDTGRELKSCLPLTCKVRFSGFVPISWPVFLGGGCGKFLRHLHTIL